MLSGGSEGLENLEVPLPLHVHATSVNSSRNLEMLDYNNFAPVPTPVKMILRTELTLVQRIMRTDCPDPSEDDPEDRIDPCVEDHED
jgi:hypothetical protein